MQEVTFEEQEVTADINISPAACIYSSSPDIAFVPPLSSLADSFKQFQDLIKRSAYSFQIPLEQVKESYHKLLDVLHIASSAHITVPVNFCRAHEGLIIQHTQTQLCPHARKQTKNTMSPLRNQNFYFLIPFLTLWWSRWLMNVEGSTTLNLHPMIKTISSSTCLVENHLYRPLSTLMIMLLISFYGSSYEEGFLASALRISK